MEQANADKSIAEEVTEKIIASEQVKEIEQKVSEQVKAEEVTENTNTMEQVNEVEKLDKGQMVLPHEVKTDTPIIPIPIKVYTIYISTILVSFIL